MNLREECQASVWVYESMCMCVCVCTGRLPGELISDSKVPWQRVLTLIPSKDPPPREGLLRSENEQKCVCALSRCWERTPLQPWPPTPPHTCQSLFSYQVKQAPLLLSLSCRVSGSPTVFPTLSLKQLLLWKNFSVSEFTGDADGHVVGLGLCCFSWDVTVRQTCPQHTVLRVRVLSGLYFPHHLLWRDGLFMIRCSLNSSQILSMSYSKAWESS